MVIICSECSEPPSDGASSSLFFMVTRLNLYELKMLILLTPLLGCLKHITENRLVYSMIYIIIVRFSLVFARWWC
ncbi:unnamed protein product [Absidia cylindrospora]